MLSCCFISFFSIYITSKTNGSFITITFIPIIWTQSTAVPVALDRNSARASSAIARRLQQQNKSSSTQSNGNYTYIQSYYKLHRYIGKTCDATCKRHSPSWVVSIPLRMLRSWVLLLLVLTTHDHRLAARVCGRC